MEALHQRSEAFQMQSEIAYITLLKLLSQAKCDVIEEKGLWRPQFTGQKSKEMLTSHRPASTAVHSSVCF